MEAPKNVKVTSESTTYRPVRARVDEVAVQFRGIRLLFWAELLCAVFMNLLGFALPFIGGLSILSMQTVSDMFHAAQILPAIAAIIAAYGVFLLTDMSDRPVLRFLLRVGVVLEVFFRSWIAARANGIDLEYPLSFWISRHLVYAALAWGVFFLCAFRLDASGDSRRPRRIRAAGLLLAGAEIVTTLGTRFLSQIVDFNEALFDGLGLVCYGVVAIGAFTILWSASKALRFVVEGRCIMCGYRLEGLPTAICPECGTAFDPQRADAGEDETSE